MGTLESVLALTDAMDKNIRKLRSFEEGTLHADISRAVRGLVDLPRQGYEEDNQILGFIKGTGKAFLGVISVSASAVFAAVRGAGNLVLRRIEGDEGVRVIDDRIDKTPHKLPMLILFEDD